MQFLQKAKELKSQFSDLRNNSPAALRVAPVISTSSATSLRELPDLSDMTPKKPKLVEKQPEKPAAHKAEAPVISFPAVPDSSKPFTGPTASSELNKPVSLSKTAPPSNPSPNPLPGFVFPTAPASAPKKAVDAVSAPALAKFNFSTADNAPSPNISPRLSMLSTETLKTAQKEITAPAKLVPVIAPTVLGTTPAASKPPVKADAPKVVLPVLTGSEKPVASSKPPLFEFKIPDPAKASLFSTTSSSSPSFTFVPSPESKAQEASQLSSILSKITINPSASTQPEPPKSAVKALEPAKQLPKKTESRTPGKKAAVKPDSGDDSGTGEKVYDATSTTLFV